MTYQEFADFDTVIKHNQNLEITQPLTTPKSSGYVKDAWIGIISLEPTVHTQDAILSPGKGELLYTYNYQGNHLKENIVLFKRDTIFNSNNSTLVKAYNQLHFLCESVSCSSSFKYILI